MTMYQYLSDAAKMLIRGKFNLSASIRKEGIVTIIEISFQNQDYKKKRVIPRKSE